MIQRSQLGTGKYWYSGLGTIIVVTWLLGGCANLPDTSGYTSATIQVKQAVSRAGDVVEAEMGSAISAGATTANQQSVDKFNAAWRQTVKSLGAMVEHAQSVEQIVDAGNEGAESARQVANSVKRLVDTVKVDPRSAAAGQLFQLSADTAAFVYGEYSKYVASQSLEEALDRFGPSIAKITTLVQAQIADAQLLFIQQIEAQIQELDSDSQYGAWIKQNKNLDKNSRAAVTVLIMSVEQNDPTRIEKAKTMIGDIEVARKQIAPRIAQYEAKSQSIAERGKAGRSLLGASENAVAAWADAHQQLVKAVKERKPISVESLTAAVVEVRTLIQRWQEL